MAIELGCLTCAARDAGHAGHAHVCVGLLLEEEGMEVCQMGTGASYPLLQAAGHTQSARK